MTRLKQLIVSFTAAPVLMLATTTAMAVPPDFSQCDTLQGTGAGYGICRAGVAVGCDDSTGNAQACTNIEEQFLAVTGQNPPWLIPPGACPCNWSEVSMLVNDGTWANVSEAISCTRSGSVNFAVSDGESQTTLTRLETGLLDGNGLACKITVNGDVMIHDDTLDVDQNVACAQTLVIDYWLDLYNEISISNPEVSLTDNNCLG